ncbi:MAG: hypothetical protein AAF826_06630 [Pseudomonadota bacterium]
MLWILAGFAAISVFIFTTTRQNGDSFLLDNRDLVTLALGEKITDPTFTGVTNDNDAFSIGAKSATPNGPRPTQIALEEPSTSIELNSGESILAEAQSGLFDLAERGIELSGNALVTSSTGYQITGGDIAIDFQSGGVSATGPLTLNAPFGEISAGAMELSSKTNTPSRRDFVLQFEGGVKLTYNPAAE